MAGRAGQLVGVGHAEHGPGLQRREGPQTDPVRQVGVQAAQPALLEPLTGQQQMYAGQAGNIYNQLRGYGTQDRSLMQSNLAPLMNLYAQAAGVPSGQWISASGRCSRNPTRPPTRTRSRRSLRQKAAAAR